MTREDRKRARAVRKGSDMRYAEMVAEARAKITAAKRAEVARLRDAGAQQKLVDKAVRAVRTAERLEEQAKRKAKQ